MSLLFILSIRALAGTVVRVVLTFLLVSRLCPVTVLFRGDFVEIR